MKECNMVRDMLPLVAEDMASEETKEFVRNHLENCTECRAEFRRLTQQAQPEDPSAPLLSVRKELLHRRALTVLLTVCVVLSLCVCITYRVFSPICLPYEEANISVAFVPSDEMPKENASLARSMSSEHLSGYLKVDIPGNAFLHVDFYPSVDEVGSIVRLHLWALPFEWHSDAIAEKKVVYYPVSDNAPILCAYYEQNNGEEDVCIYGDSIWNEGNSIALPRLFLGYYLLMAAGALVVFGILYLLLRRAFLLHLLLLPACYIAAHAAVLGLRTVSYTAAIDLLVIVCVGILFYTICLCVRALWRMAH